MSPTFKEMLDSFQPIADMPPIEPISTPDPKPATPSNRIGRPLGAKNKDTVAKQEAKEAKLLAKQEQQILNRQRKSEHRQRLGLQGGSPPRTLVSNLTPADTKIIDQTLSRVTVELENIQKAQRAIVEVNQQISVYIKELYFKGLRTVVLQGQYYMLTHNRETYFLRSILPKDSVYNPAEVR